jgi:putative endonuclease
MPHTAGERRSSPLFSPLILAEARTQVYGRRTHFKGCLAPRRVGEHREGLNPGFTSRYAVKILVWHEAFDTRDDAFRRERRMKVWRRAWKIELIEKTNPGWRDLYPEIC